MAAERVYYTPITVFNPVIPLINIGTAVPRAIKVYNIFSPVDKSSFYQILPKR
jgi:hypothetical protein